VLAELIDDAGALLDRELERQRFWHPLVFKLWLYLLRTLICPLKQEQGRVVYLMQLLLNFVDQRAFVFVEMLWQIAVMREHWRRQPAG